jgi:hypothetical protein
VLHLTSDGSYTHTRRQTTHKKLLLHKSRHRDLKREGNKKSFCGEFHKGCYLKKEEAETDVMVLDSYTGARLMSAKRGGGDETVAHHRRPAKNYHTRRNDRVLLQRGIFLPVPCPFDWYIAVFIIIIVC